MGFNELLNLLNGESVTQFFAVVFNDERNVIDLTIGQLGFAVIGDIGFSDCVFDFLAVEFFFRPVSLDDLHSASPGICSKSQLNLVDGTR